MLIDDSIGVQIPRILLPRPGIDLSRWAVIACDQYTSQPDYWSEVERIVGENPSTYHLTLPEIFLGTPEEPKRIHSIQNTMQTYLKDGTLEAFDGMVYVERRVGGKTRRGLVLALDLEHYDYTKGSTSLVRATEGTIVERLPPRMKIRQGACLELPHILVLIDDPQRTVIEPVARRRAELPTVYDFELMCGSGHLAGYRVSDLPLIEQTLQALRNLAAPRAFQEKYRLAENSPVLLFAMGDGNHSLATAKAVWEQRKAELGPDHPARYALVEIENVHDEGLEFEPIHRVVFGVHANLPETLSEYFGAGQIRLHSLENCSEMMSQVDGQTGETQWVGIITAQGYQLLEIQAPTSNLPVGSLQAFLDDFCQKDLADKIDYVHGAEVACQLGSQPGNAAFYLPAMSKNELFKTVILDGSLPRKTFSMGEAHEKRFYMEARQIG